MAYYIKPDENREKIFKFKNGDKKEKISCLKKKYFDKRHDRDKLAGYVHLRNKKYSGKEFGTLENTAVGSMDIYSRKRLWQGVAGYIQTEGGEYLGVTRNYLLLLLLFLGGLAVAIGLLCGVSFRGAGQDVLPPDFSQVVEVEEDDCNCDITAQVILPEGKVTFDGEVDIPEDEKEKADGDSGGEYEPYVGEATIKVTLEVDGVEHILVDTTRVEIANGEIPDVYIDFTKLDFELKPGIYYGFVYITYKDGASVVKPIRIVILDTESGMVGIGYSDQVYVRRSEDMVSLKYVCQESTTNTIIQVIIKSGDSEILIAQSGIVNSGDTIRDLSLDSSAKARLQTGSYKGILRVYFDDTGVEELQTTDLKTDIEVTINVQ